MKRIFLGEMKWRPSSILEDAATSAMNGQTVWKRKRGETLLCSPSFSSSFVRTWFKNPLFKKAVRVFNFFFGVTPFFSKLGPFAEVFPRSIWHRHPFFQKMYKKGTYDVLDTVGFFSLSCANLVFCFLKKKSVRLLCSGNCTSPKERTRLYCRRHFLLSPFTPGRIC